MALSGYFMILKLLKTGTVTPLWPRQKVQRRGRTFPGRTARTGPFKTLWKHSISFSNGSRRLELSSSSSAAVKLSPYQASPNESGGCPDGRPPDYFFAFQLVKADGWIQPVACQVLGLFEVGEKKVAGWDASWFRNVGSSLVDGPLHASSLQRLADKRQPCDESYGRSWKPGPKFSAGVGARRSRTSPSK